MKDTTRLRLESLLPTKSPNLCFTTYLPLVESFRENDWERNIKRVNLHKQLVNIELNKEEDQVITKLENSEKLGRGHKSGSRRLLEDFLTNLDLENYRSIGKTLFAQGYLSESSVRKFLFEASELIDGVKMTDDDVNTLLKEWE